MIQRWWKIPAQWRGPTIFWQNCQRIFFWTGKTNFPKYAQTFRVIKDERDFLRVPRLNHGEKQKLNQSGNGIFIREKFCARNI